MKKLLFMFIFCFTLYSATVADVATKYIEPSEAYILTKISTGGKDYWIINIEGKDELLIDSTPSLLTDKNKIENVFLSIYEEEIMLEYKKNQVRDLILQFNESQYPARKLCEQYTGLDRMPCYDKESCLISCNTVGYCAGTISENKIYGMLDWNIARKNIDESITTILTDLEKAKTSSDFSKLKKSINSLEKDMKDSLDNYIFINKVCNVPDISYTSLTSAKEVISNIESSLNKEVDFKQKANSIYELSNARVDFINTRTNLYTEIHVKVSDLFKECEYNYAKSKVYDEDVEIKITVASKYVSDMLESKNEGNYRIAIEKGNKHSSELVSLKNQISVLSLKRSEIDIQASKVLENYEKSLSLLSGTKYHSNLTAIKEDTTKKMNMRIVSSELLSTKEVLIDYENQIKEMVSDCVLNGCEKEIEEEVGNGEGEGEGEGDKKGESEVEDKNVSIDTNPPLSHSPTIIDSLLSLLQEVMNKILSLFGM